MSKSCLNYNMMTWDLEVGYMQQRNQTKAPSKGSKTYQFECKVWLVFEDGAVLGGDCSGTHALL